LQFIPVLLVVANASCLSGERYLTFNYDVLNAVTPEEYCCVSTTNGTPGWNDCPQTANRRPCRTSAAAQRKRHLDRFLCDSLIYTFHFL